MKPRWRHLAVLCMLSTALPVQAAGNPVREVRSLGQCPWQSAGPALLLLEDAGAWTQVLPFSESADIFASAPDWQHERVAILSLGERPNPGYRLEFVRSELHANSRTLEIRIREQRPAPDAILPQVITRPCLLLRLDKAGWRHLQVEGSDKALPLSASAP